ncbi:TetR family transcriptional regulator [Kribbella sp. ALI-6-A]|uniref:TetR/AcrR family transcriptional regulator n=1 Tax=Kribbella sp. ALI-6-A TaxID=1933817 RepID=UPI00097CB78A|nr:TetR/AcrR family transcriptional regulator [Kribbella sp. ALI-6-A]ONI73734.1 TetR family transcriptional regulator [Kribbella sp. ALI-6-A]
MAVRLTKQARREQLLDAATTIVRTQGADGLTLVTLAEAAGVSRPIVYDHFGTRSGLLIELYRQLDERYRTAISAAVQEAPPTIDEVARVISAAYFACAADMPELTAISAALKGSPEMESVQHELLGGYVDLMAAALSPYSELAPAALRLRCVGILGAADAIARENAPAAKAVPALAALIAGGI